jgi:hypothetical protein
MGRGRPFVAPPSPLSFSSPLLSFCFSRRRNTKKKHKGRRNEGAERERGRAWKGRGESVVFAPSPLVFFGLLARDYRVHSSPIVPLHFSWRSNRCFHSLPLSSLIAPHPQKNNDTHEERDKKKEGAAPSQDNNTPPNPSTASPTIPPPFFPSFLPHFTHPSPSPSPNPFLCSSSPPPFVFRS